jgi:iron complex outermembrane receptor protein
MRIPASLLAASLVATTAGAYAADTTTAGETAKAGGDLLEVVVTARRREESLKDVPIAVTALSGDTLRDQQVYAVKDVAAYSPGLNINSDSVGRAFVSMRGIGTTLIETVQPGVGIFIDGIYQPNTSYLNSPLVDVERVEVLRGPQGTLFGNNTLGGAINVITRQPGNDLEARLDAAYANQDNFKSLSASVGGAVVDDVLKIRMGAAYHTQDGFERNLMDVGPQNPLEQKSANATVVLTPAQAVKLTLNLNYDQTVGGSVPYFWSTGPRDYSLTGMTNVRSVATLTYKGASLKGEFDLDSIHSKLTAVAAYNRRDGHSSGDGDFGPVDFLRSTNNPDLTTRTGEVRLDTDWSDRISTLVGVFASKAEASATGTTTIVPFGLTVPAAATSQNDSTAVFATVFAKLNPTLDLAVGLRYDHQKLDASNAGSAEAYKANEFQPRFTLTKRWNEDTMTYASLSRGVRGGGQNGPGAPNLIYRGDNVWTYELGAKVAAFDQRLDLSTAVFYNDYNHYIGQNALAPSTTGVGFVAINLNAGHVKSYGVEAEASLRVTDQWRVYGGLTLLHARVTDNSEFVNTTGYALAGDRILFVPDWNFNLGTNYRVALGADDALVFDAAAVAKGSRTGSSLDSAFTPVMESYTLVNASIAWQHKEWTVALFGTNLANEKYMETYLDKSVLQRAGLGPLSQNLVIQGDRRRMGIRASFRF